MPPYAQADRAEPPQAAQQVEREVGGAPQCQLDREAEQEEKQHVAQQVPGAAVQEGGREPGDGAEFGVLAVVHGPVAGEGSRQAGLVLRAGCSPVRVLGVFCGHEAGAAQPLLKVVFVLHPGQQRTLVARLLQRARLGQMLVARLLQPRHKARHLNGGQGAGDVEGGGAVARLFLGALRAPEHKHVHQDQQHGHPRRVAPGGPAFEGDGVEHGSAGQGQKCRWRHPEGPGAINAVGAKRSKHQPACVAVPTGHCLSTTTHTWGCVLRL